MRWIPVVIFALAAAVAAGDFFGPLAAERGQRFHALGEWWAWIDRESLLLFQPAVERHLSPALWDPWILTLLELPAAFELASLGALLLALQWFFRRRRARGAP